jgi:hypothetical protein
MTSTARLLDIETNEAEGTLWVYQSRYASVSAAVCIGWVCPAVLTLADDADH